MEEVVEYLQQRIVSLERSLEAAVKIKDMSRRDRLRQMANLRGRLVAYQEMLRFIESMHDIVCKDCPVLSRGFTELEPDAHSCREYADADGYCQVCGAVVHGSPADYEIHGYDPPGTC